MKQINIKPSTIKHCTIKRTAIGMLLLASLVGCDSIPFINNTSDYKGAGRSKPLEVPPDLTASPVRMHILFQEAPVIRPTARCRKVRSLLLKKYWPHLRASG